MDTTTQSPGTQSEEQEEFVILVAVSVHAATREAAERALHQALPDPARESARGVECWWIAEDDRRDGSDNDSALFVPKGSQEQVRALLCAHGLGA